MAKTYAIMKTSVGNQIRDTSTGFATIIGTFLNNRYRDIWRRAMWSAAIRDSYTFEAVASTANYALPGGFEEELFVANIAQGYKLSRSTMGQRWQERTTSYSADSIGNGTPREYTILENELVSGVVGALRLDPPPGTAETYAMPYKRKHTDLIGTTDTCTTDTEFKVIASAATFITDGVEPGMRVKNTTDSTYGYVTTVDSETQLTMETDLCPDGDEAIAVSNEPIIPDIENIIELGAISDAWAYKREFTFADFYNQKYEHELARRIGQERSKVNQRYQFVSAKYRTTRPRNLLGDQSYDTV